MKECLYCGKPFEPKTGKGIHNLKYCSLKCRKAAGEKYNAYSMNKCTCFTCGKHFYSHSYLIHCPECKGTTRPLHDVFRNYCLNCGAYFEGKKNELFCRLQCKKDFDKKTVQEHSILQRLRNQSMTRLYKEHAQDLIDFTNNLKQLFAESY